MPNRLPVVFISHGAPDALLNAPSARASWRAIGAALPRPKTILAVSAHWEETLPTISLSPKPATLHDFAGFPRALYAIDYPVPGAPDLARRVIERFAATGTTLHTNATRGLDHGAWVPLLAMFPEADIPVAQLALPHPGDAADLLALGTILRPLRDEGVLILASGAITHNFGWLRWNEGESTAPLPRAKAFADWVGERIAGHDIQGLADYRTAPWGSEAHPSAEHFMPLFAALGAADGDPPTRHQPPFTYGGLAMDSYVWGAA
jgi:4,5-DOPA dioxygenase extradiol